MEQSRHFNILYNNFYVFHLINISLIGPDNIYMDDRLMRVVVYIKA